MLSRLTLHPLVPSWMVRYSPTHVVGFGLRVMCGQLGANINQSSYLLGWNICSFLGYPTVLPKEAIYV